MLADLIMKVKRMLRMNCSQVDKWMTCRICNRILVEIFVLEDIIVLYKIMSSTQKPWKLFGFLNLCRKCILYLNNSSVYFCFSMKFLMFCKSVWKLSDLFVLKKNSVSEKKDFMQVLPIWRENLFSFSYSALLLGQQSCRNRRALERILHSIFSRFLSSHSNPNVCQLYRSSFQDQ